MPGIPILVWKNAFKKKGLHEENCFISDKKRKEKKPKAANYYLRLMLGLDCSIALI